MEASEPKCVNPILNYIGVNSLRLGGLRLPKRYVNLNSKKEIKTKRNDIELKIIGRYSSKIGITAI